MFFFAARRAAEKNCPPQAGFLNIPPLATGLPVLKMKIEGVGAEFSRDHFAHFVDFTVISTTHDHGKKN